MKYTNIVFPAAVYLSAGSEVYQNIFEIDETNALRSADEALRYIKGDTILSQNQKRTLYLYMSLYAKLTKIHIEKVDFVKDAFGITEGFQKNIDSLLTEERLQYILNSYSKDDRVLSDIFTNPDEVVLQIIENIVCMPIVEEKQKLKRLTPEDYEHMLDKAATSLLKKDMAFKTIRKIYDDYTYERRNMIIKKGSLFRVTQKNIPQLYDIFESTCNVLGINKLPELYIDNNGINAYTIGTRNPMVVIGSGCLSLLSVDELIFVIGHELGHIKSSHNLYREMLEMLMNMMKFGISSLPLLGIINDAMTIGLLAALSEWDRKAELSADRAGLLACQNPDAVFTTMTKLLGYPMKYYDKIDKQFILEQAKEFDELDADTFNKIEKNLTEKLGVGVIDLVLQLITSGSIDANGGMDHPWTVMRAKEIDKWINDGSYHRLMEQKVRKVPKLEDGSSFKISFK